MNPSLRTFLSPFVAVAFTAVAATGILMSLEVESHAVTLLHEWSGWAFAVAGTTHLVLNWRSLVAYLRQRTGVTSVVCALVLVFGLLAAGGLDRRGEHGERAHREHAED